MAEKLLELALNCSFEAIRLEFERVDGKVAETQWEAGEPLKAVQVVLTPEAYDSI